MAGIETYGGCCPKCAKGLQQKWEASESWLKFDACPWCGFIGANGKVLKGKDAIGLWDEIFEHFNVSSLKELQEKHSDPEYPTVEESEFYPSIYNYSDEPATLEFYRFMWKRHGSGKKDVEKVGEFIGKRVKWSVPDGKLESFEGTIVDYKAGTIYILWDGQEESKIAPFEYQVVQFGKQIHEIVDESSK